MRISMTIPAGRGCDAESPQLPVLTKLHRRDHSFPDELRGRAHHVAGDAIDAPVGTLEPKHGVVILERIARRQESFDPMTRFASASFHTRGQLASMFVEVAVRATGEPDTPVRRTPSVTTLASHTAVPAAQRIVRHIVIEARFVDPVPPRGRVAPPTGHPEAPGVRVFVTIGTTAELHIHELGELPTVTERLGSVSMASLTGDLAMPPGQGKPRLLVPEASRRQPLLLRVAAQAAIGLELAPMLVPVARQAFGPQAQKRPSQILAFQPQAVRVAIELGAMTVPAAEIGMPALELVPRQSVLEHLLPLLSPPDELKLPPVMVDMAGLAVGVLRSGMEPSTRHDPLSEDRVATEASPRVDALLRAVALETVRRSLQPRVGSAQRARRELRGATPSAAQDGQRQNRGDTSSLLCTHASLPQCPKPGT